MPEASPVQVGPSGRLTDGRDDRWSTVPGLAGPWGTAEMSRRHNDANVLCISADLLGEELIERMIKLWLETEFEGGRHARRVDKITRFEAEDNRGARPSALHL